MLEDIAKYTNQYARHKTRPISCKVFKPISKTELCAAIGLLYTVGITKGCHESVRSLWQSDVMGCQIFCDTMSCNRFEWILSMLCFDDRSTKETCQQRDIFSPFRILFDQFIANCQKFYMVGDHVTVDEPWMPFRGRCSFLQYLPSKPDKYESKM